MAFETDRQGYWKFDESSGNAIDSSGNDNTLVNENTVTFDTGKVDNGALFVAANTEYFHITNNNQTGLGITGDISISLFVKLTTQPSDSVYYFCNKSDEQGNQRAFSYYYYDTGGEKHLRFCVGGMEAGRGYDVRANDLYDIVLDLPTGDWCNIIMTWDASAHTAKFYKKGIFVATSTGTVPATSIYESTSDFMIGAYTDSSEGFWHPLNGMLDEFMVWDRVVTEEEIKKYLLSVNTPALPLPAYFN